MEDNKTVVITKTRYGWQIALGLIGTVSVFLIIMAFMFPLEARIIFLTTGATIALGTGVGIYFRLTHNVKLDKFEQRRLEAEVSKLEYEADIVAISRYFKETKGGVFILNFENKTVGIEGFKAFVSASKEYGDIPLLPESTTPQKYRKFLDIMPEFVHLLIVGPTKVGKSTLMCHIIDNSRSVCYVLDPHKTVNENEDNDLIWPYNSIFIGDGRNWKEIDHKLSELLGEMNRRYNTKGRFDKILIIVDEWLSVLDNCEHAPEFFRIIGSEARKVNMSLVIGTQSQTVDDLKVSAAIRDNLTQVTLNRGLKEQNLGEIVWSRGNKELVELPGKYRARLLPSNLESKSVVQKIDEPIIDEPVPELDGGPAIYSPTQDELKIYELYLAGNTLNAIWKQIYPNQSYGGNQANELKTILSKFGVGL